MMIISMVMFLWMSGLVPGQPLTPEEEASIENLIQGVMGCRSIPGMSVAAVRGAEVVLAEGYGVANVDTGNPVTSETLFAIASITKQFTGILLSKLTENFEFTWDTPLRELLGDNFYFSTGFRSNNTNLRDLLSHKTGIPRNDYVWILEGFPNRSDIIERMRFYEPVEDMRNAFIYNNLMFLLAGAVAEAVAQESWETLIQEELFEPIGMDLSSFADRDGNDRSIFATAYLNQSGTRQEMPFTAFRSSGLVGPAASIASNADDMGDWLVFLLTGEGEDGTEVMPMDLIEDTWASDALGTFRTDETTPIMKPDTPVSYVNANYGKGFANGYYRGYSMVQHGGDLFGHHSVDMILPDLDIGVFVSMNQNVQNLERRLIALHILDVLIGETPWLNVSYICNDFVSKEEPITSDMTDVLPQHPMANEIQPQTGPMNRELAEYVGTYGHFGYGNATVTQEGIIGNLTLRIGTNGVYELLPLEGDTFSTVSVGESWYRNLIVVEFASSQGNGQPIDELIVPRIEVMNFPVFRRGLRMSDAPPPRLDTC